MGIPIVLPSLLTSCSHPHHAPVPTTFPSLLSSCPHRHHAPIPVVLPSLSPLLSRSQTHCAPGLCAGFETRLPCPKSHPFPWGLGHLDTVPRAALTPNCPQTTAHGHCTPGRRGRRVRTGRGEASWRPAAPSRGERRGRTRGNGMELGQGRVRLGVRDRFCTQRWSGTGTGCPGTWSRPRA
uniref:Uncharacterized protein n=1 Tax=Anser brachyrhynchus TaxID=132585 RepID=A0A8B9BR42_9AVES